MRRAQAAARISAAERRPQAPTATRTRAEGSTYNAKTGNTNNWGTASVGNNHYADVNGNVYSNTGNGWQQHNTSGTSAASGNTSWADRESQARTGGSDCVGRRRPLRRW